MHGLGMIKEKIMKEIWKNERKLTKVAFIYNK